MSTFKIGDLVRVYDNHYGIEGEILLGKVVEIFPKGLYKIKVKHLYSKPTVHTSSCAYPPEWLEKINIDDYVECFI